MDGKKSSSRLKLKSKRLLSSPSKSSDSKSSKDVELIEDSESQCDYDGVRKPRAARVRHQYGQNSLESPGRLSKSLKRESPIGLTSPERHVSKRRKMSLRSHQILESPASVTSPGTSPKKFSAGIKKRNVEARLKSTAQKNNPTQTCDNGSSIDPKVEEAVKPTNGNVCLKKVMKIRETGLKKAPARYRRRPDSETKMKAKKQTKSQETSEPTVQEGSGSSQIPETDKNRVIKKRKRTISIEESPASDKSPKTATSDNTQTPRKNNETIVTATPSLEPEKPASVLIPDAAYIDRHYKKKRHELALRLYKVFNEEVFDNRLPKDMELLWFKRLGKFAGTCATKRKRNRRGVVTLSARIKLCTKVVDRSVRLRDTLIHEMCHAAAWLFDGVRDKHGPIWSKYTSKAMQRFPELPVMESCNNYAVAGEFVYKCEDCGNCVTRSKKSLNTSQTLCTVCRGKYEVFRIKRTPEGKSVLVKPKESRGPNAFALFVKEHYNVVKDSNPDMKHPQIMKKIGAQYAVTKGTVKLNNK